MNKIDLIIDALDGITNGNYNPRLAKEALAAARELKALKPSEPVAWITKGGKGELWWHQSVDENGDNNPKDVPLYAKEQS